MTAATPVRPYLTVARGDGRRLAPAWRPPVDDTANRATILIADSTDINRRLLRGILKSAPYRILECTRGTEALEFLERENVDLVIVDMLLPEISGAELCWRLKQDRAKHLIPIIMLTSIQGVENEINGINSGADEFLTKPLHPSVVRTRIRAMLRNKAATDSLEEAESILFALAQIIEQRDSHTSGHCNRLADFSVAIGAAVGLPREDLIALHRGGFLHDIGKISIPDAVLFKEGPLTAEEWDVMQSHTVRGEEICRPMRSLAPVLPIIRSHHERWNGSGYPDGLSGEGIPLLARILQLADIYDALVTARPYKRAFTHEEALAIIEEETRLGWRDPELVSVFREIMNQEAIPAEAALMHQSLENMQRELAK